jgi:hypothetical protein
LNKGLHSGSGVKAFSITPSPLYSGERAGVRGGSQSASEISNLESEEPLTLTLFYEFPPPVKRLADLDPSAVPFFYPSVARLAAG